MWNFGKLAEQTLKNWLVLLQIRIKTNAGTKHCHKQ
jgi:hypothetical protein